MTKPTKKAVLVTTEFKGVFFGIIKNSAKLPKEITLTDVRNCIYWPEDTGGFLGLAATGPNIACRIGAKVPESTLYGITSVTPTTAEAKKAWLNHA